MKINWDRWIRRDRRTLLFSGYLLCISSIFALYSILKKARIKDSNDLAIVTGQFNGYNFVDGSRGFHDYTFTLKGFTNYFQIDAEFLDIFRIVDFKQIAENTELTIAVPKTDLTKLNTANNSLFVYLIKSDTTIYLDSNDAIEKYNSTTYCYLSGGFILLGLVFIYFGYKSKIKSRIF